jgi:RpiB/LacA/LacB family sugar-phosphate isomerase
MAEGILKRMLKEVGEKDTGVSSAGVGTFPGWKASREALATCREMQIDISDHRSRPVSLDLIRETDLILTMEKAHSDRIMESDPLSASKVRLLGSFDPQAEKAEIDDPVGQPLPVFRACADRLFAALKRVVQQLPQLKESSRQEETEVKRIAIGADHRGFETKQALVDYLKNKGYEVVDCGASSPEASDHPDMAFAVSELVRDKKADRGVLVCSNGIGMCISANKVPGVYAARVVNAQETHQARQHNGANVVCFGSKGVSEEEAARIVDTFLTTDELDGEEDRYKRRRDKIVQYEEKVRQKDGRREGNNQ